MFQWENVSETLYLIPVIYLFILTLLLILSILYEDKFVDTE